MSESSIEVEVLAHYQAVLSRLLRRGASPDEIREMLSADPMLAPMHSYVSQLQDAPLEVAAALAAKWGRRESTTGEDPPAT